MTVCVCERECLGTDCYLCACNFTYASDGSFWRRTRDKYPVASEKLCATAITLHSPESEQMERAVQWNKHNERSSGRNRGSAGRGGAGNKWWKQHLAGLCSVMPADGLKVEINPLIEVTFSLNTVSSGYFKHIFPSLNLPSTLQMSSALNVVKWDYERLDRIWAAPDSIPIGGCNPAPHSLLPCLIIRWPTCVAGFCHIPARPVPSLTENWALL